MHLRNGLSCDSYFNIVINYSGTNSNGKPKSLTHPEKTEEKYMILPVENIEAMDDEAETDFHRCRPAR